MEKTVMIVCVLILIIYEMLKSAKFSLKIKELVFLLIIFLLLLILFMHLNGYSMFPLLFFIYSSRNIEFKKITKFTAKISLISLFFIIISAFMGIIENYEITTVEFNVIRKRTYLGFRYPLFAQMIMFNITLCEIYTNSENISFSRCILLMLLNYVIFYFTNARLSFYNAAIIIIFSYLFSKKPMILVKRKVICSILIFSFPICAIISLFFTYNYDSTNITMAKLNEFLGGRLQFGKKSFSEYEINLFGHDTNFVGAGLNINGERNVGKYNFVDCLYINMLEKYGIVFNLLFFSLITYVMYKSLKERDYYLFIILVSLAFHGMIDNLEMYLYYNAFWLVIGKYISSIPNKNRELVE